MYLSISVEEKDYTPHPSSLPRGEKKENVEEKNQISSDEECRIIETVDPQFDSGWT